MNDMVIWKYELELKDEQVLAIPTNAEVLSAGLDPAGKLCVWVLTCPTWAIDKGQMITIVGTGNPLHPLFDLRHFIGTVTMPPFVWHIFRHRP